MTYIRKTVDVWAIMWGGGYGVEEVDSFTSYREARLMVLEYNIAFGGGCWIKKRREKKEMINGVDEQPTMAG